MPSIINASTSSGAVITSDTSGDLAFQNNGTTAVTVTGGNVGIGTSSPSAKLQVSGTTGTAAITSTTAGNPPYLLLNNTADSSNSYIYCPNKQLGIVQADTSASSTVYFSTQNTERMRIDSAGNVGIGTSSPDQRLNVTGPKASADAASQGQLRIVDTAAWNGSPAAGIQFGVRWNSAGNLGVGCSIQSIKESAADNNFAQALLFTTQANGESPRERMRIDSSGNLLVGTTGISTGTFPGIQCVAGGGAGTYLSRHSSGTANRNWNFGMNSSDQFQVYGFNTTSFNSGAYIAWGGTSWTASSDERLKDIIEPITDAVNKVATLRTVIGKYKTDEEGTRRAFLIAQDVQAVLPEAVDASNPEKLGVSYTDVIPLLVAAIKEQQALITDLTTRLTSAEEQILNLGVK